MSVPASTPQQPPEARQSPVTTPRGQRLKGDAPLTLRQVRAEHGISLSALEARTGISRADLSKFERGRSVATAGEIRAIAAALDLDASSFSSRTFLVFEAGE
jgi:ribosome-binding protein aMBF1 (putative translation factor)